MSVRLVHSRYEFTAVQLDVTTGEVVRSWSFLVLLINRVLRPLPCSDLGRGVEVCLTDEIIERLEAAVLRSLNFVYDSACSTTHCGIETTMWSVLRRIIGAVTILG